MSAWIAAAVAVWLSCSPAAASAADLVSTTTTTTLTLETPTTTTTTTTTSTTVTTTTTTTLPGPDRCRVSLRIDEPVGIGAIQVTLDYSALNGGVIGEGAEAQCTDVAGGTAAFFDDGVDKRLNAGFIYPHGLRGPRRFGVCKFRNLDSETDPQPSDFQVTVTDAADAYVVAIDPRPAVSVAVGCGIDLLTTTTTTIPPPTCGHPASTITVLPATADALFVLRAAVQLQSCAACVCDVDDSGGVSVVDAHAVLRASVALGQGLDCPACTTK